MHGENEMTHGEEPAKPEQQAAPESEAPISEYIPGDVFLREATVELDRLDQEIAAARNEESLAMTEMKKMNVSVNEENLFAKRVADLEARRDAVVQEMDELERLAISTGKEPSEIRHRVYRHGKGDGAKKGAAK